MIIIINGSVGVGKSSVSWELQGKFDKSVMLDGDYIGAVHPFEIYDNSRIEYLYDTLLSLITFHKRNGYDNFVINYVFESESSLLSLIKRLKPIIPSIYSFWITCSVEEQTKRIEERNTGQKEWELKRFVELNDIQVKASEAGFIGERVATEHKSIQQVSDLIWDTIGSRHKEDSNDSV